jgi:N-methylhydantoinase A/oxoprolinase/acetone carboxylase beta subunit
VTDADVVLGYLNPAYFAAGTIRLDVEAAAHGIERALARPLGRDLVAAAWTVHDVVNETMAAAVRMHVTERGGNPARATLFAFGGAGPVHAYHLAAALGMPRLIVPLRAGVLSALGLVIAPVAFDLVRTHKQALAHLDPSAIEAMFRDMREEVRQTLEKAQPGVAGTFTRAVDVGYIGQGYQVTVPVDEATGLKSTDLWSRFAAVYREKYGYFYDDVPAELVNLRVSGRLTGLDITLPRPDAARALPAAPKDERPAYSRLRGRMMPFVVYDRSELGPGVSMRGPAIFEEASATTVIDDGGAVSVDDWGSLVVAVNPSRDGATS